MPHKGTKGLHYSKITTGGFPTRKMEMRLAQREPITTPVFSVCFWSAVQILPCKGRTRPSCFCCSASVLAQNTSWPARGFPVHPGCTLPARDGTEKWCFLKRVLTWLRDVDKEKAEKKHRKRHLLYLCVLFTIQVIVWVCHHQLFETKCRFRITAGIQQKEKNEGHTYSKTFPSSFVADYAKQNSVSLTVTDGTVWGFPFISFYEG